MARDSLNACNVIGLYSRSFSRANHLTTLLESYFKVMFRADQLPGKNQNDATIAILAPVYVIFIKVIKGQNS
jgi:hypothetical protein